MCGFNHDSVIEKARTGGFSVMIDFWMNGTFHLDPLVAAGDMLWALRSIRRDITGTGWVGSFSSGLEIGGSKSSSATVR